MDKLNVEELVRAAIARSTGHQSPGSIRDAAKLRDLGYDEADVLELKTRLMRAVSRKKPANLAKLRVALNVTPESSVKSVITRLQKVLPPSAGRPAAGTMKRGREVQAAVVTVLSEKTPKFDFTQIEPGMTLGADLGLDEPAIAEAKIQVFKTLGGKDFSDFEASVKVGGKSTVKGMVDSVCASLPGDDTIDNKG
jgi:hypothetical protein